MRIIFPEDQWVATRAGLLDRLDVESCAIAFGRQRSGRLIIREVRCPEHADYVERSSVSAQLSPEFIFETVNRARSTQSSLVFIHTHPRDRNVPVFSPIDDAGCRSSSITACLVVITARLSSRQAACPRECSVPRDRPPLSLPAESCGLRPGLLRSPPMSSTGKSERSVQKVKPQ